MLLTAVPCAMADVDKKEMVYVLANASGEADQIIVVSERLYNSAILLDTLEDVSRLSGIENLSGDRDIHAATATKSSGTANGSRDLAMRAIPPRSCPSAVAVRITRSTALK